MNEERVTKSLLKWLTDNEWEIVCYDFPQSGTGIMLHKDLLIAEKNKEGIIPDIVAVKDSICLFFENKDRFYYKDYLKANSLITNDDYKGAIENLLSSYVVSKIYYGIGLPAKRHSRRSKESAYLVDFIIGVNDDYSIKILHSVDELKI